MVAQAKFAPQEELASRKREREEEEEAEAAAEEEEQEEIEEEDAEASQVPQRVPLSPVPAASRGSPVKRIRFEDIDMSPPEATEDASSSLKENTEKQSRSSSIVHDGGGAKQLFSSSSGNPFAKSLGSKGPAKDLASSLSGIAQQRSGMSTQSRAGGKLVTKKPVGKAK
jgi:hypothetical protein